MRFGANHLWQLVMKMKWRHSLLLILGLFAVVWNIYVWTVDDPPDLGAVVTVMGLASLTGIYLLSALEWFTSKEKDDAQKSS